MKLFRQRFLLNSCLGLSLVLVLGGWPSVDIGRVEAGEHSLDSAVARVQEQTGGRILRARQKDSHYVIKVLMP